MSHELRIVVTTFAERDIAEKVAGLMVDAGLAVCAQVGTDLVSFYRWDGVVKRDQEVAVTFKVLHDRFDLFTGELKLQHPYDIPQIISWPAEYVNRAYLEWAQGKTT
jgi:periplasmic divalent cation tolerance protein